MKRRRSLKVSDTRCFNRAVTLALAITEIDTVGIKVGPFAKKLNATEPAALALSWRSAKPAQGVISYPIERRVAA
jgi:hypothetical protein